MLKRQSLGMPVDASLADQLLHNPYEMGSDEDEGRRRVGRLLAKHPMAITALLRTLFQPGGSTSGSSSASRSSSTSLELKMKCAKLIALAVLASERCILDGLDSGTISNGKDRSEKFSLLDEGKLANVSKGLISIFLYTIVCICFSAWFLLFPPNNPIRFTSPFQCSTVVLILHLIFETLTMVSFSQILLKGSQLCNQGKFVVTMSYKDSACNLEDFC